MASSDSRMYSAWRPIVVRPWWALIHSRAICGRSSCGAASWKLSSSGSISSTCVAKPSSSLGSSTGHVVGVRHAHAVAAHRVVLQAQRLLLELERVGRQRRSMRRMAAALGLLARPDERQRHFRLTPHLRCSVQGAREARATCSRSSAARRCACSTTAAGARPVKLGSSSRRSAAVSAASAPRSSFSSRALSRSRSASERMSRASPNGSDHRESAPGIGRHRARAIVDSRGTDARESLDDRLEVVEGRARRAVRQPERGVEDVDRLNASLGPRGPHGRDQLDQSGDAVPRAEMLRPRGSASSSADGQRATMSRSGSSVRCGRRPQISSVTCGISGCSRRR